MASSVGPELRVRARHLKGGGMLRHASLTALLTEKFAPDDRLEHRALRR